MTVREKAIEAAARRYDPYTFERAESPDFADFRVKARDVVRPLIEAAAPHIESALLDRIEEKVKDLRFDARRLRDRSEFDSTDDWVGTLREAWSDDVLAVLSQIRDEAQTTGQEKNE